MQRRQLARHLIFVLIDGNMAEFGAGRNRELLGIVKTFLEAFADAVHLVDSNESIPIRDGAPPEEWPRAGSPAVKGRHWIEWLLCSLLCNCKIDVSCFYWSSKMTCPPKPQELPYSDRLLERAELVIAAPRFRPGECKFVL